jgi:hypothetical protein
MMYLRAHADRFFTIEKKQGFERGELAYDGDKAMSIG